VRRLSTFARAAVACFLFFALFILCAPFTPFARFLASAEPEASDTPKRVGGRVEETIMPGRTFKSDAERMERIVELQRRDDELIAKMKPPIMYCRRVPDGSIKIDGKLDDPAWKLADVATDFKNTRPPFNAMKFPTRAMLLWDSKYLYVGFDCPDTDVVGTITERDGELWREDAAEVFLNPSCDGMTYLEYEVSPRGVLYDGALADYRPETDWLDYKHLDVEKSLRIYNVRDSKVAAHVDGTLNDSTDEDQGWTCEMAISWADIARGTFVRTDVPRPGDRWRVGLYRINVKAHGDDKLAEYGAWSPTTVWYHNPKLFGHVIFLDQTGEKKHGK